MKAATPVAAGPLAGFLARGVSRRGGPAPGRIHRQIRKGRLIQFDSAAPAIRIGGAVKLYVEVPHHPREIPGRPAAGRLGSRGCV